MNFYFEIVGYIASILVLISLMMSSVLKLRLINLAGAFFFTIYGVLIGAVPIMVVNFFIILVNLYYLYKMYTNKEYFTLLEVSSESAYLQYFLDFYREDIQKFIPDYRFTPKDDQLITFVLRDLVPAGLFIGQVHDDKVLKVYLDFVIGSYRDFKIGDYLYHNTQFFQQHGVQELKSTPQNETHAKYLKRMGFQANTNTNGQTVYCLPLKS